MQLARHLSERRLACRDELLRHLPALVRQLRQRREQSAVRSDQVCARDQDRGEGGGQEPVHLPLDPAINRLNLLGGLALALVVLDEQPRHRGAERRLPGLKRETDLRPRFFFVPLGRQCEHPIDGIPELCNRTDQVLPLLGCLARDGHFLLPLQRIIEIGAYPQELGRPGCERVLSLTIEHVAHRQAERVEIVLDAQQLKRVPATPIDEVGLQAPQPGDLPRDVPGIRHDGRNRNRQPDQKTRGRRPAAVDSERHRAAAYNVGRPPA